MCFKEEVNKAKNIIIKHCPIAKQKSKAIENKILAETAAIAIMLAKIGEEQGLEANAKNAPTRNGNKNKLPDLFCGIFFTIAGKCISKIPVKFSPKITITEAKRRIITGEANPVKALPVKAQITPTMLKISDKPSEKEIICINNFLLLSFE